jgi:diaminopimelate decarboxylase
MNIVTHPPTEAARVARHKMAGSAALGDAALAALDPQIETPAYVYDLTVVSQRFALLSDALAGYGIRYAVKANPHPAILRHLIAEGALIDASSIGEVRRAIMAGAPPAIISFTGPGKRRSEIEEAVALGIGHLVVESLHQAEQASEAALRQGVSQSVLARISPATSPKGFGARMTGVATQFGIDEEEAPETLAEIAALPGLNLDGLHFYAGSNSLDAAAIGANMQTCADLAKTLVAILGRPPKRLIFGSGFGVPYHEGQQALVSDEVAAQVRDALNPLGMMHDVSIDIELGRWLVAPAGQLLIRVLTRKSGRGATIAICDGGFNVHMAACGMMGSVVRRNWPIRNISSPDAPREKVTLAGPLCTSIDLMARDLDIALAAAGDMLAVGLSGAYGPTASPQGFISQPAVREMIWDGHRLQDETPGDIAGQIRPMQVWSAPALHGAVR